MSVATATRRSKAWIAWGVVNALITFFGLSYIFFPGKDVVQHDHKTEGIAHLPANVWGAYVVASALTMLAVALLGLRRDKPWARRAALYEFPFLFLVVVIEPDPVVPVILAAILGTALWRSRPHNVAADDNHAAIVRA
jgi:hypothetical protein